MATATVTISRPSSTDTKPVVPINTAHDANLGNFRYADQTNALQHHPSVTGFGQPGQAQSVSLDHAAHNSASPPEGKVAITPMSQQQPLSAQRASIKPSGPMGPLSKDVVVPARPKPGRKPLPQEDAQDRRRVQNRMAQRNFRDKRAQKVSELTADNERIRRESEDAYKKLANQLQDHKERNANLIKENERLRDELDVANKRAEDADRKLHSIDVTQRFKEAGFPNAGLHSVGTGTALPSMATSWEGPVGTYAATAGATATSDSLVTPHDEHEEYPETDMSAFWASTNRGSSNTAGNRNANSSHIHNRNHSHNNVHDNGTQWLGNGMDLDRPEDACGFCTDGNNCACAQAKQAEVAQTTALAPGGCDACIRDPARAAACKALAAQTELSQRPATSSTPMTGVEQRNDSMAQPSGMMSCSKFVDSLGSRVPSIHELFPGTFHAYPSQIPGRGYDVNEQEAAQVLQSMSRRNTLAGPPANGS